MILQDLNKLGQLAKAECLKYNNSEFILSEDFKREFSQILHGTTDRITYDRFTSTIITPKGLKIPFPNQWFFIASYFYDYLTALFKYKEIYNILQISKESTVEIKKTKEIPEDLLTIIDAYFQDDEDRAYFKLFLADYNWWYGSKTINRGDFFVSPVLNLANVVNESTSYIAGIAITFTKSHRLIELLNSSTPATVTRANLLQKIYYGAPGSGKSFKIETVLKQIPEEQKERITFHPDYDYVSFVGGYKPTSDKDGNITYSFVPEVFTKIYTNAWLNPHLDFYLAIEEINRGNCAEIFGDIFQILDRQSEYSISPSLDLKSYLQNVLPPTCKGISDGKIMLPENLNILASMNTSDQSLFPMDSAFKRRWNWEYVPINYEPINEDGSSNDSFNYIIKINNGYFSWIDFIKKVNARIKTNSNLGQDKCIGNYFIKADNKSEINFEEFINKVVFYLWIDVFKDEEDSIFEEIEKNTSYEDFFPLNQNGITKLLKLLDILKVEIIPIEDLTEEDEDEDEEDEEDEDENIES
ncbi:AAA family ATPase [Flavobacterium panici]|uniref:ATPase dynein-related AAA domain-containing protein n=1 Tax=Flavobacterium panici TaxID=2654843 RepID=A0A9N8J0B6_9FLAO|nr:AAA family ATPase [Flavobacterium panici]CAC9973884.1 hypothetical protein FLAPXU55_01573 [Flavobacterium panici]